MAFCPKCGCPVDDGAAVCSSCGSPLRDATAEEKAKAFLNTPDHSGEYAAEETEKGRIFNALAYLGITFWLPLINEPKTELGRFHANQGLLALIVWLLLSVVSSLFGQLPLLGAFVSAVCMIIGAFYSLFGIINTINGKAKELPLIGKIRLIK